MPTPAAREPKGTRLSVYALMLLFQQLLSNLCVCVCWNCLCYCSRLNSILIRLYWISRMSVSLYPCCES